jgi:imidazoleglycerol-phosphate dehydratase
MMKRIGDISRKTRETDIQIRCNLDGKGKAEITTGIGFFDHMLDSLARHSGTDLIIRAKGDLHVDDHHTVEDVGLCLGEAIRKALGDKKGIARFGWALCPMDEALARTAIDLSGRPYFVFTSVLELENVENLQGESLPEFFRAVSNSGEMNLHLDLIRGENTHHAIEVLFKSFAKALKQAISVDPNQKSVPSTKGVL